MTEPRHIILNPETRATIHENHVAMIRQGDNTIILDAEQALQILLAMKDPSAPEPPKIRLDEEK